MEHNYEEQADKFLTEHGFTLKAAFKGDKCPKWDGERHIHGDRYRVTIRRNGGNSISFDFWNSLHDKQNGVKPTNYDILSCVSSELSMPQDPDEVVAELGEMKPSQAIAAAKFSVKLNNFFTEIEAADLSTIQ